MEWPLKLEANSLNKTCWPRGTGSSWTAVEVGRLHSQLFNGLYFNLDDSTVKDELSINRSLGPSGLMLCANRVLGGAESLKARGALRGFG